MIALLEKLGFPTAVLTTVAERTLLRRGNLGGTAYHLLGEPFIHEAIFRMLPSNLAGGQDIKWEVGIISGAAESALQLLTTTAEYPPVSQVGRQIKESQAREGVSIFGALGQIYKQLFGETLRRTKLDAKIPLLRFGNSLFYWQTMRNKGYRNAVMSHAVVNSFLFWLGRTFNLLPPKSEAQRNP